MLQVGNSQRNFLLSRTLASREVKVAKVQDGGLQIEFGGEKDEK